MIRPPIDAQLNERHPLIKSLAFLVAPSLATRHDYVGRGVGNLLTSGSFNGMTKMGTALQSTSTSDGGAAWAFPPALDLITTSFTILVWADVTTLQNWSTLLCIPYANAAWVPPYGALALQKHDSSSSLDLNFASGGSANSVQSAGGMIQTTDGLTMYGGSRENTAAKFWRNGRLYDSQTYGSNGTIDLVNKQPVTILNHSSSSPGEGIVGTMPLAMIFNRALTAEEWMHLYNDPFLLLRNERRVWTAAITPILDLHHYQWRNDDGSETTATAAAAEDTSASIASGINIRLRTQIDATNDPASAGYKLQYRKVGGNAWRTIE